eukprot:3035150-Rhodomonas_salina.7
MVQTLGQSGSQIVKRLGHSGIQVVQMLGHSGIQMVQTLGQSWYSNVPKARSFWYSNGPNARSVLVSSFIEWYRTLDQLDAQSWYLSSTEREASFSTCVESSSIISANVLSISVTYQPCRIRNQARLHTPSSRIAPISTKVYNVNIGQQPGVARG